MWTAADTRFAHGARASGVIYAAHKLFRAFRRRRRCRRRLLTHAVLVPRPDPDVSWRNATTTSSPVLSSWCVAKPVRSGACINALCKVRARAGAFPSNMREEHALSLSSRICICAGAVSRVRLCVCVCRCRRCRSLWWIGNKFFL